MTTLICDNYMLTRNGKSPDLLYTGLMLKFLSGFLPSLENASPAIEVVKIILKAITSDNPEPVYLAGNNANMLMDTRRNLSDREFEKRTVINLLQ